MAASQIKQPKSKWMCRDIKFCCKKSRLIEIRLPRDIRAVKEKSRPKKTAELSFGGFLGLSGSATGEVAEPAEVQR